MKKATLLLLVSICFSMLKAQNNYTSIGINGIHYTPTSSQPVILKPFNAKSIGVLVEHYFNNHRKIATGISYYEHEYKREYRDTDIPAGWASYKGLSKFITVPLTASYNFMKENKKWEFFVDAGFLNFIHIKTTEVHDHTTIPEKRFTQVATHTFTNHYFMAGITARYKLHKKLYFGFGTKTHHYLKLSRRVNTGFPTISLDGSIAYIL